MEVEEEELVKGVGEAILDERVHGTLLRMRKKRWQLGLLAVAFQLLLLLWTLGDLTQVPIHRVHREQNQLVAANPQY